MLISSMDHIKDSGDNGLDLGGDVFDLGWNIWSGSIMWFNMFPNEGKCHDNSIYSIKRYYWSSTPSIYIVYAISVTLVLSWSIH